MGQFFQIKCPKCGKVMKGMLDANDFQLKKIAINCGKCGAEVIADADLMTGFWD